MDDKSKLFKILKERRRGGGGRGGRGGRGRPKHNSDQPRKKQKTD